VNPLLVVAAVHQGAAYLRQHRTIQRQHAAAVRAAERAGKPFLVVGGPYGSAGVRHVLNAPAHPPGDVCVDIDPRACKGLVFRQADIRRLPFPDGQFGSVLCSHVLEHLANVEDVRRAWGELHRVADEVYIAVPEKDWIYAHLMPDHRLWVQDLGGGAIAVQERGGRRRQVTIRRELAPRAH